MSPETVRAGAPLAPATRVAVVAALRGAALLDADGDATGLVRLGGMSNVCYRVTVDGRRLVVRLPESGHDPTIDRGVEMHNSQVAAAHGLGAPVVFADPVRDVLVSRFVGGHVLSADDLADGAMVECVGWLLRRVHALEPALFRGRFDPFAMIDRYCAHLAALGVAFDAAHEALIGRAEPLRAVLSSSVDLAPCHNDPGPANIIADGARLVLIDWEYSGIGDPLWDLAHFAVEADLDRGCTDRLLAAWNGGPASRRLAARLTLWRPVTDLVWGCWAQVQHAAGSRVAGLDAYADRRLRTAEARLSEPRIAEALSTLDA